MQIKRRIKKQNGSALVLTLIAVLILSSLAVTGLTVSSTEIQSTQNFYLNKRAYYTALEGVEEVRNEIFTNPDPEYVTSLTRNSSQTMVGGGSNYTYYITGSMEDLRYFMEYQMDPPKVDYFKGFDAPPLPGVGLGGTVTIAPVIWSVHITSCINTGKKKSYAEIQSGIYSIVSAGY